MIQQNKVIVLGVAHPHIYRIASHVQDSQRLTLIGVYDIDSEAARAGAERLGVPRVASLDEAMADEPALALIGAQPEDRVDLAVACLEKGVSALVDKPLALTTEDLSRLRAAADRSSARVMCYYPLRAVPLIRQAVAVVEAGQIGTVTRVSAGGALKLRPEARPAWHFTREGNGGILIDMGAHYFDLCCWVAGSKARDVSASHVNRTQPAHQEFQDAAQACIQFDNGVLGQVDVNWLLQDSAEKGEVRMSILGTEGRVEIRVGDETSGRLWNHTTAGEDLQPGNVDADAWGIALVEALAFSKPTQITQEQVFLASEVALRAFDSAEATAVEVVV